MAIIVEHTIGDLAVQKSYLRVMRFFGGPTEGISSVVEVYSSKGARQKGFSPLCNFNHTIEYSSGDPMELLYASLASMYPEHVDDMDVVSAEIANKVTEETQDGK